MSTLIQVTAKLLANKDIPVRETELGVGAAFAMFMREVREVGLRVIKVLPHRLMTNQPLRMPERARFFLQYEGPSEALRPLREALWYYALHPHRKSLLDAHDRARLEEICLQYRPHLRRHADAYHRHAPDGDVDAHWRLAVLFAARVSEGKDIAKAMRLPEDRFEDLLSLWVDDPNPGLSFGEMLSSAYAPAR